MADNTHTPAPWRLDDAFHGNLIAHDYHFIDAGIGFHGKDGASGFGLSGILSLADARLIAASPTLLAQLKIARAMLANYAAYDERHGLAEDAAYTRRRLVDIDAIILSAEQGLAKCPDCDGTGMALNAIGEPDTCRACRGDTVVATAKAEPANV